MNSSLNRAQQALDNMPRIDDISSAVDYVSDVLLLPQNVGLKIHSNGNVATTGLGAADGKVRDIVRIIEIKDALNGEYTETNCLSPLTYIHSLKNVPHHITTQGFLLTRLSQEIINWIKNNKTLFNARYSKHSLDKFWLSCSRPLSELNVGDCACIFNRRVGGWDGSPDSPVIELLGAGGHLQSVWDDAKGKFVARAPLENLRKEFNEEIGLSITPDDVHFVGGFNNESTSELVLFYCITIPCAALPSIQSFALGNVTEDTDGVYLGTFNEVMRQYKNEPKHFAGGYQAAPTNFPNRFELFERLCKFVNSLK